MLVQIDHARADDHVGRVDDLGISGIDTVTHLKDLVVFDQNVAAPDIANRVVHRHDPAALNECTGHHASPR